jgi:hypothetical protein
MGWMVMSESGYTSSKEERSLRTIEDRGDRGQILKKSCGSGKEVGVKQMIFVVVFFTPL